MRGLSDTREPNLCVTHQKAIAIASVVEQQWILRSAIAVSAGDPTDAMLVGARARALFARDERPRGRCHACRPREVRVCSPCSCSACSPRPLAMRSQESWTWELVVKYRLRQALPSSVWHALGRLSTGCNLSRVAACCEW